MPASAKAIEERLAKLKREGRAFAAEKGASATATAPSASSAAPAKKSKKGVAVVKKVTGGTKRKAPIKAEDSEEDGEEELDLGESDEENEPPAKKPKSGKNIGKDKPAAMKARPKLIPTGPKRVTLSDDEGNDATMGDKNVGELEVDSSSEETDKVKHEET